MSSASVLILLGVLILLAPFSGLPFSWLTFLLVVVAIIVIGIGVSLRARTRAASHASPEEGRAPSSRAAA